VRRPGKRRIKENMSITQTDNATTTRKRKINSVRRKIKRREERKMSLRQEAQCCVIVFRRYSVV
jgi:hypothetical protein